MSPLWLMAWVSTEKFSARLFCKGVALGFRISLPVARMLPGSTRSSRASYIVSKSACLCAVNRSDVDAVCPICGHLGFGVAPGKTLETKAFTLQPLRYVPSFCCCWQSLALVGLWTVPGSTGEVFTNSVSLSKISWQFLGGGFEGLWASPKHHFWDDNGRLNMVHQELIQPEGIAQFPITKSRYLRYSQ